MKKQPIVYGIKNCDTVKKALKYLDANKISYTFSDIRENNPDCERVHGWQKDIGIKKLFNSRSTTYRNLKLKEKNLNDEEKIEWLCKEPMLLKRPVIEYDGGVLCGYDEGIYKEVL